MDVTYEFNWPAVRKMGPLGLLSLNIPEEYGGAGVDAISAAIAIEEIGWGCGSTALAIAAHNGLGTTPIVLYGSEELKQKWLPLVASGQNKLGRPGFDRTRSRVRSTGWSRHEGGQRMGTSGSSTGPRCGARTLPSQNTLSRSCGPIPDGGSRSLSQILVPTNTTGSQDRPR